MEQIKGDEQHQQPLRQHDEPREEVDLADRRTPERWDGDRRCLTCGHPINGGDVPFCSMKHLSYSVFGEPALRKAERHSNGQYWPVEDSDRVKRELVGSRKEWKTQRKKINDRTAKVGPETYPQASIWKTRKYRLQKWEIHYLKEFAKHINQLHRETGSNRNVTGGDDWKLNFMGFAGEFAFARLFNTFPDLFTLEVRKQAHKGGGVDAYLPNGLRVDVKTTGSDPESDRYGITIEANKDEFEADVYVLMDGSDFPTLTYAGFIPTYHAHTSKYATDFGHFVPGSDLRTEIRRVLLAPLPKT